MNGLGAATETLIIGCGNLLRGDDGAGPILIRRLWELGLPEGVRCADGGTGGMDVAFQMRGVKRVILVDACQSGSTPGSVFMLPGSEVEQLPPLTGINLHCFRWDHALAFAHWLLKEQCPEEVIVYLVEAGRMGIGDPLSEEVDSALDKLALLLHDAFSDSHTGKAADTMNPLGAQAVVIEEDRRWTVYLEVTEWAEDARSSDTPLLVRRIRIESYATEARAKIAARWIERTVDRTPDIRWFRSL